MSSLSGLVPFWAQKVKTQNSANGEFEPWGYRAGSSRKSKIAAFRQLDAGASITAVARACEINPSPLHRWRRDFQQATEHSFPGLGTKRADENRIAELERKIGQQALEIDFSKRRLQRIEQGMLQALTGKPVSTNRSGKK